ncbi:YHS domain-containing protein [bacterium]|nr:YHS domain-containing protein [bacterium]
MELGSLVWLLIFGGLFYFMMAKGGCGAHGHGGHGGHGSHGNHDGAAEHDEGDGADSEPKTWQARDPVCGAVGPVDQAQARVEYAGNVYHFCSHRCRELFDQNPEKYLNVS